MEQLIKGVTIVCLVLLLFSAITSTEKSPTGQVFGDIGRAAQEAAAAASSAAREIVEATTKKEYTIDSYPTGAQVYVNTAYKGITPLTINLSLTSWDIVVIKKQGYYDYIIPEYRRIFGDRYERQSPLRIQTDLIRANEPSSRYMINQSGRTAELYIDGIQINLFGQGVIREGMITPGFHEIGVRLVVNDDGSNNYNRALNYREFFYFPSGATIKIEIDPRSSSLLSTNVEAQRSTHHYRISPDTPGAIYDLNIGDFRYYLLYVQNITPRIELVGQFDERYDLSYAIDHGRGSTRRADLFNGRRLVQASLQGYLPTEKVPVEIEEMQDAFLGIVMIKPGHGILSIRTPRGNDPETLALLKNTLIFIDDQYQGILYDSELRNVFVNVPSGNHRIKIKKSGYRDIVRDVSINALPASLAGVRGDGIGPINLRGETVIDVTPSDFKRLPLPRHYSSGRR